jgi:hypothetical protein
MISNLILILLLDSLALDFNEYSAAWQSLGNSKSEGRVKVRHELSKAVSRTATAS